MPQFRASPNYNNRFRMSSCSTRIAGPILTPRVTGVAIQIEGADTMTQKIYQPDNDTP